ncbi:MAG: hypothetical protein SGI90_04985 [Candidatus Eisenbacteria bacterium]|nr:hypothetical protein [Candidatus Eisenbacteria bacterium]
MVNPVAIPMVIPIVNPVAIPVVNPVVNRDRRTAGKADFGLPGVVNSASKRKIYGGGGPAAGPWDDMMIFKGAAAVASYSVLADKGALAIISIPDFAADGGGNVSRCSIQGITIRPGSSLNDSCRRLYRFPISLHRPADANCGIRAGHQPGELSLFESIEKDAERPVEDLGRITIGNLMSQQFPRLFQLQPCLRRNRQMKSIVRDLLAGYPGTGCPASRSPAASGTAYAAASRTAYAAASRTATAARSDAGNCTVPTARTCATTVRLEGPEIASAALHLGR